MIQSPLQVQEDREAGGVDELGVVEVEHHVGRVNAQQVVHLGHQFWRCQQVQFTLDPDREDPAGTMLMHRKPHRPPGPERFPQRLGRRIGHIYWLSRFRDSETPPPRPSDRAQARVGYLRLR